MKIIITESQYNVLSNSLKRRLTSDDFKYFDTNLVYHIEDRRWEPNFNQFSYEVISGLVHEFIVDKKYDELPEYDDTLGFDADSETNKIFEMYSDLMPFLEKKYKNRLYQAWKVKGRSR